MPDDMCPHCGHEWRRHDPEDGRCDAHSAEQVVFGPCRCGRDVAFTAAANARLSRTALDRVRDARGDDEASTTFQDALAAACGTEADGPARPPQGEDHEADRCCRTSWVCDACGWSHTYDDPMTTVYCVACFREGRGVDVLCRRTFPSRDGTVAVEDVAEWLRRQRSPALQTAFLAEFARSATGEQPDHGGDQ